MSRVAFSVAQVAGNYPLCEDDCFVEFERGFYAVFDGHGGRFAVDITKETLFKHFEEALKHLSNPSAAMKEAFSKTDDSIRREIPQWNDSVFAGCCVSACYFDESNEKIIIANTGDCRVVLAKKQRIRSRNASVYQAHQLTKEHTCHDQAEIQRIVTSTNDADIIRYNEGCPLPRIGGYLTVTRALGDFYLKDPDYCSRLGFKASGYITCEPDICEISIQKDDEFIIMASDGFWELMTNQEAVDYVFDVLQECDRTKTRRTRLVKCNTDISESDNNDDYFGYYDSSESVYHSRRSSGFASLSSLSSWIASSFFGYESQAYVAESPKIQSHEVVIDDEEYEIVSLPQEKQESREQKDDAPNVAELLLQEALRMLSMKTGMTLESLKKMSPRIRRHFHDDISVIVIKLK